MDSPDDAVALVNQPASRIRAVSSFLLDRDPLLVALAARLGGQDAIFESAIRGGSMAPAIPSGSRLRVRLGSNEQCLPGAVVFFLSDSGFVVHRVVSMRRRRANPKYLITLGDNCLVPDPPVSVDRVLGVVESYQTTTGWRPPGPPAIRSTSHRLARAMAIILPTGWLPL